MTVERRGRITELDLLAYADGQYTGNPAMVAAVDSWLSDHPEDSVRMQAYCAQTAALRRAYGPRISEPVPDRLLAVIENDARPFFPRVMTRAAAAIALVALAAATGWFVGYGDRSVDRPTQSFVNLVEQDYERSTGTVGASGTYAAQSASLERLSQRISFSLRVPDLSALGYSVVDSGVMRKNEEEVNWLVFAGSDRRHFTLFLKPRWQEPTRKPKIQRSSDVSLAYWFEGPLASAIATRLPEDETMKIAEAVRSALAEPQATPPALEVHQDTPSDGSVSLATGVLPPNNDHPARTPGGRAVTMPN